MREQTQFNFQQGEAEAASPATRVLTSPPSLTGIASLSLDTETTNEKSLYDRKLVGISYRTEDGRKDYLPIRHPRCENHSAESIQRWARCELREKQLIVSNAKHEVDTLLRFGVDLEEQGCRTRDVFNQAALLSDHRYQLNLNLIAEEELGRGKINLGNTEEYPIHLRTAAEVAPYAIEDAVLAWELNQAYTPKIAAEGLGEVLDLEDALVYAVCEMERNGTHLDVETLCRWDEEVTQEYERRILQLHRDTGLRVNPNSGLDLARLFGELHLQHPYTVLGNDSFPEEFLMTVDHPAVRVALEARQISSLQSKYLGKYRRAVTPGGLLRYQLHQLRGDRYGTITGRFSSSKINIQQVSVSEKQPPLLQRWPIRKLFIPAPGGVWMSADANQIEFRIFAHYSARLSRRLVDAYVNDPRTDFHALVMRWTQLSRPFAKNVNFCKLYGGGAKKVAFMCKVSLPEADGIVRQYDREFPEAAALTRLAARQAEEIGYVRTFLGRRRRYPHGLKDQRFYSALNAVFQGTAADIMKRKILELYRARKRLGLTLRFTVHDEVNGDVADAGALLLVQALLNEQTTPLEVPIIWDAKIGKNWAEAH